MASRLACLATGFTAGSQSGLGDTRRGRRARHTTTVDRRHTAPFASRAAACSTRPSAVCSRCGDFQSDELPQQPPESAHRRLVEKSAGDDGSTPDRHITSPPNTVACNSTSAPAPKVMPHNSAIERLRELGIANAIVAVAGDIHVAGSRGERRLAHRHSSSARARHPRAVELNDGESISTSGDYQRYFTYQETPLPPPARSAHRLSRRQRHLGHGHRPRRRSSPMPPRRRCSSPARKHWPTHRPRPGRGSGHACRRRTAMCTLTPAMATRVQYRRRPAPAHYMSRHFTVMRNWLTGADIACCSSLARS